MKYNDKMKIWTNTACFVNDKMYLSTNPLSGLYSYDLQTRETFYVENYETQSDFLIFKNRFLISDNNIIFIFPYGGEHYEIYDTESDRIVWRERKKEGYFCHWVCEIEDRFFIFEYNDSIKKSAVMIWNKQDYSLEEWTDLSLEFEGIEVIGVLKIRMSVLGNNLIIALNNSDNIIVANTETGQILEKKMIDEKVQICMICSIGNRLCVLLETKDIVLIDSEFKAKYYRCMMQNKILNNIIAFKNKLFGFCDYDFGMYKLELNDEEGTYCLEDYYENNKCEANVSSEKRPYVSWTSNDSSLFLLPLEANDMVEYIDTDDTLTKVNHPISIVREQLEEYISNQDVLFETDQTGSNIDSFIEYVCLK